MRSIYNSRTIFRNSVAKTQRVIDQQAVTATVTRRDKRSGTGPVTWSQVAQFQCRIDPIKPRMEGAAETETTPGFAAFSNFLLLSLISQDKFGAVIDIKHDDEVEIEGDKYRVTNINKYSQWGKIEAVLEIIS